MTINDVIRLTKSELTRQNNVINLVASENYTSYHVRDAVGSIFTNKYAEGTPEHRYYGGCTLVDQLEKNCCLEWRKAFHTNYHINVQPHSGSQANMAAYMALMKQGDTILGMNLSDGGHLTHGSKANFSGKLYESYSYGVNDEGWLDMDEVRKIALSVCPKVLVCGASAYPRTIDFKAFRKIADEVGAFLIADISHIAGLVAAGLHNSPFEAGADIVTTTTHKTLGGPRGALIFCKPELAKAVDSAVFPRCQGGPAENVIAGKLINAIEVQNEDFATHMRRTRNNIDLMAKTFTDNGLKVLTGGTDNHLLLLDLTQFKFSGRDLQKALEKCNIIVNANTIPNEKRSPTETSGIRIGTTAMTTRNMGYVLFKEVANMITECCYLLQNDAWTTDEINRIKQRVAEITYRLRSVQYIGGR